MKPHRRCADRSVRCSAGTPPRTATTRRHRRACRSPSPQTFIPIAGTAEQFPVRRIYCIGRNYAAHAREMGSDPNREPPFFFQKPTDAIQIAPPGRDDRPSLSDAHEELSLRGRAGRRAGQGRPRRRRRSARSILSTAYTVGLDMTRRDLQRAMGDEKKPWEIGKSFDQSAVLGLLQPASKTGHLTHGAIWLKVNGEVKQNANLEQMIWTVAEQVEQSLEGLRAACPATSSIQRHARERRSGHQGRRHGRAYRRPAGPSRQGSPDASRRAGALILTAAAPFALDCEVAAATAPGPTRPGSSSAFFNRGFFHASSPCSSCAPRRCRCVRRSHRRRRRRPRSSRSRSPPTSRRSIRTSSTSSRTTTSPSTSSTSWCRWTRTRR